MDPSPVHPPTVESESDPELLLTFKDVCRILETPETSVFAKQVFAHLGPDETGRVKSPDVQQVVDLLTQGSQSDKLALLFSLYDASDNSYLDQQAVLDGLRCCTRECRLPVTQNVLTDCSRALMEAGGRPYQEKMDLLTFQEQFKDFPELEINPKNRCKEPHGKQKTASCLSPNGENWKIFVLALFLHACANVALFLLGFWEHYHIDIYLALAKAFGRGINFNCVFIILTVERHLLSWLRRSPIARYLPLDYHMTFHVYEACMLLFLIFGHVIFHVIICVKQASSGGSSLAALLFSIKEGVGWVGGASNLTGWVMLGMLLIIFVCSIANRLGKIRYEVFQWSHHLIWVLWFVLIIHAAHFWMWFIAPGGLFLLSHLMRSCVVNRIRFGKIKVQNCTLLPSEVTQISIQRPRYFNYKPGDYLYLNIPSISRCQWHPFTISSAPENEEYVSVHVRAVGSWTKKLRCFLEMKETASTKSDKYSKWGDCETGQENMCGSWSHGFQNHGFISESTKNYPLPPSCIFATRSSAGVQKKISFNSKVSPIEGEQQIDQGVVSQSDTCIKSSVCNKPSDTCVHHHNCCQIVPCQGNLEQGYTLSYPTSGCSTQDKSDSQCESTSGCTLSYPSSGCSTQDKSDGQCESTSGCALSYPSSGCSTQDKSDGQCESTSGQYAVNEISHSPCSSYSISEKTGLSSCYPNSVQPHHGQSYTRMTFPEPSGFHPRIQPCGQTMTQMLPGVHTTSVNSRQLQVNIDGPYSSFTSQLFQCENAVLIGAGIGVTPFASVLQSISRRYQAGKQSCPNCEHSWAPTPKKQTLKKVDFFWICREHKSFEWFIDLLKALESEQDEPGGWMNKFLDLHLYLTSGYKKGDIKTALLQLALDTYYNKTQKDPLTGLSNRTNIGRPDWHQIFQELQSRQPKPTIFYCGPPQLTRVLRQHCTQYGLQFKKESLW